MLFVVTAAWTSPGQETTMKHAVLFPLVLLLGCGTSAPRADDDHDAGKGAAPARDGSPSPAGAVSPDAGAHPDGPDASEAPEPGDPGASDAAGPVADVSSEVAPPPEPFRLVDVSDSHLPASTRDTETLDVGLADVDGDGDLDVVIACERQRNRLLLNDGRGRFQDVTEASLPAHQRDSEDLAIADFNGDGRPDLVFVTEDGQTNELYLNVGGGRFMDGPAFPVGGTSNAVVVLDLEGDGDWDLIIGNRGQNFALVNDGRGVFTDETALRLPVDSAITQDLALGDVDGDGDLDLVVGNEGRNRLLLNDGTGRFTDATLERLPSQAPHDETREVAIGDVDGDGDLDLFFANAARSGGLSRQDRLLLNDGNGSFRDETATRLPTDNEEAMDGKLIDLDQDGDLDIVISTYRGIQGPATPYRVFENDGQGMFEEATAEFLPASATGHGFDVEAGDLNGDGHPDLYLGSGRSRDRLLLTEPL